mmetsp:Transcript_18083/g.37127  ORF Transcript_18083/g.37127 Transcript_18083/m.37127 type:complete len:224 (-) Transcript_18083:362-1033(-)
MAARASYWLCSAVFASPAAGAEAGPPPVLRRVGEEGARSSHAPPLSFSVTNRRASAVGTKRIHAVECGREAPSAEASLQQRTDAEASVNKASRLVPLRRAGPLRDKGGDTPLTNAGGGTAPPLVVGEASRRTRERVGSATAAKPQSLNSHRKRALLNLAANTSGATLPPARPLPPPSPLPSAPAPRKPFTDTLAPNACPGPAPRPPPTRVVKGNKRAPSAQGS